MANKAGNNVEFSRTVSLDRARAVEVLSALNDIINGLWTVYHELDENFPLYQKSTGALFEQTLDGVIDSNNFMDLIDKFELYRAILVYEVIDYNSLCEDFKAQIEQN